MLREILATPVSPELLPPDKNGKIAQKTEDTLGPYEVHDFFLYHFQRFGASPDKLMFMACRAFDGVYSREQIEKWLRLFMKRFFSQQFKRLHTGRSEGRLCQPLASRRLAYALRRGFLRMARSLMKG